MSLKQPTATLENGAKMPLMAFGTLMENLEPDHKRTVEIVENAIDVGYRHMDCAAVYQTEVMVGEAIRNKIKAGVISREDIFVTTKLWRTSYKEEDVVPALKQSLQYLGLDYVDLYLVHWPTAFQPSKEHFPKDEQGNFKIAAIDYMETWRGMEQCFDQGLTKAIGLSNFNSKQLQRILDNCKVKPANNQIESHPFLTNTKLIKYCQERGVSVMAYTPLGGFNAGYREAQKWPTIFTDETIKAIAAKHKRTPAQVALRFQLQRDVGVAPKSAKKERMLENFQALDFELSQDEMQTIENLNKGYRLNAELPEHPYYPFNEEF